MVRCLRWRILCFILPALLDIFSLYLLERLMSVKKQGTAHLTFYCIHPQYSILLALTCSHRIHMCCYLHFMIGINHIFFMLRLQFCFHNSEQGTEIGWLVECQCF